MLLSHLCYQQGLIYGPLYNHFNCFQGHMLWNTSSALLLINTCVTGRNTSNSVCKIAASFKTMIAQDHSHIFFWNFNQITGPYLLRNNPKKNSPWPWDCWPWVRPCCPTQWSRHSWDRCRRTWPAGRRSRWPASGCWRMPSLGKPFLHCLWIY